MLKLSSAMLMGASLICSSVFAQSSDPVVEVVGASIEGGDCKVKDAEFKPVVEINGNGASVSFIFSNYKSISTDIENPFSTCDFRTTFKFPDGITGSLTRVEYRGVASGQGTEDQVSVAGITREYSWIGSRVRDVRSDVFGFDERRNAQIIQSEAEEVEAPQFFNPRFFVLDEIKKAVIAPCFFNERTLVWNSTLFTQEPFDAPDNLIPTQIELTSVDVSSEIKFFVEFKACS
ncbi:hypothetical protein [Pseudobacteriovorax antillogorgiicola]|uniref:DUF4360 domain-containing protein n=1 Tax=Pseudobacteriovorax antillogorgiicola TaxID=1513793 RepID=A0A1Y6CD61_9BACT|nr:hypothetical protein [Pseudobacteriovorax antillogorgiicola]TCS48243.1 hypothetical protein EDD56_11823 [Pseudobacteriovorax antillogorgiicola]SMF57279.1 hypothetical protein SAMN06296036_118118 [Pseudobacteriovorax antillogorgiicola]